MNTDKGKKIIIVGAGNVGSTCIRQLEEFNNNDIEIIQTPEEIQECGIILDHSRAIKELPIIEMPFILPETRAERRAKARKERKRKNI